MNRKNKKEGPSLAFVTFKSHFVDDQLNSWWIDIVTVELRWSVDLYMLQICYRGFKRKGDKPDEADLIL